MFAIIREESYLRSYFSEGHKHESFNCCFSIHLHCNPWESDTIKALGLYDFNPKSIFRRDTSFSSTVAKRYSWGVLQSIKGRDWEKKNKTNQDGAEESHVGPQKNAPLKATHISRMFLPGCWFWLVAGNRSWEREVSINTKKQQVGVGWHDRDPREPCKNWFPVDLNSKGKQPSRRLCRCHAALCTILLISENQLSKDYGHNKEQEAENRTLCQYTQCVFEVKHHLPSSFQAL